MIGDRYFTNRWGDPRDFPAMPSDEVGSRIWLPIFLAVLVLIVSSAIIAEQGIHNNEHRGPIPEQVIKVKDDLYLMPENLKLLASDICLNGGDRGPAVASTSRIASHSLSAVDCSYPQVWNVHAGPDKSFIPDGLVETVTAPWYWSVLGALLIIFFPYGYLYAYYRHRKQCKRREERERADREKQEASLRSQLEAARELLVGQWSNSAQYELDDPRYISDEVFEKRLGEIDEKLDKVAWDASSLARFEMDEREAEFNASPEGERYKARLESAQFMRSAITGDMKVADYHDSDGFSFVILGATFVPEFIPGLIRDDFLHGVELSDDELPF